MRLQFRNFHQFALERRTQIQKLRPLTARVWREFFKFEYELYVAILKTHLFPRKYQNHWKISSYFTVLNQNKE